MWPDKELEYIKLADDPIGIHYGLFDREQLVSVISLFVSGREIQFRKFATCREKQRQGFGTKLLHFILQEPDVTAKKRIWCNARSEAVEFYARFGFAEQGEIFWRDGAAYVKMIKQLT